MDPTKAPAGRDGTDGDAQVVLPLGRVSTPGAKLRPGRPRRIVWICTVVASASHVLASGCGRRATHEDCQLIVDRGVELQMKEMKLTDGAAVRRREELVRDSLQAQIEACEGRRVTERTLACVRSARSPKELDQCLR